MSERSCNPERTRFLDLGAAEPSLSVLGRSLECDDVFLQCNAFVSTEGQPLRAESSQAYWHLSP